MSPSERKAMINPDRTDLSLTRQCKLLKISRSSLYYAPIGMNAETLELMNEIDRVFTKYPFFGSRQIAAYLPRNGFHAGRHRVRRLMGVMGLQGRCCTTLIVADSLCESMRLDRLHEQTITRPLPHHELAQLYSFTEEAWLFADLAGQGYDLACAA